MDTYLTRYKDLAVLFVVLFAQFIGLATQIKHPLPNGQDRHNVRLWRYWVVALVAPPEKLAHGIGSGLRGFWDNYIDLRDTRAENQRLLAEVARLHLEQAGLLEDARQGQRLQSLLQFKEKYVYQTVPAEVIGTAGTDQSRILYINKGSRDGLAPDMPVITPDGVVGRLKDVFPHTAQVLAINDQTSGAGVLLETTRLRGVLRGNVFGQPQIINILPDERIKAGEPVVTSGGDQIYPRGLPVGTVERVVDDPEHDPYKDVIVKPAANLSHLEEVLVITQTSDQLPASAAKDIAKSEAAGAADADLRRASDILAERLPSIQGTGSAGDTTVDDVPASNTDSAAAAALLKPIKPPLPLHPDRYSPVSTPPAEELTPGGHITGGSVAGVGSSAGGVSTTRARAPQVDIDGSAVPSSRPKVARPKPSASDETNVSAASGADTKVGDAPKPAAKKKAAPKPDAPADQPPTVDQPPAAPQARLGRPSWSNPAPERGGYC